MRIGRIFVIGHRTDLRFTRCCIASIRRWYPHIRVTLIKDYAAGDYDTSELENCCGVDIFSCSAKCFGWGVARLEPLFLPERERCLILDSDIVFAGPVLERLEKFDEEFVVEGVDHAPDETKAHYFDPELVARLFPDFCFPGFVFNVGQMVATTGILKREMFGPFIEFCEPRRFLQPEIFFWEQGVLNFMLAVLARRGEVSVRRDIFMRWAGVLQIEDVLPQRLEHGPSYDFLIHWAGFKQAALSKNPLGHVLTHFELAYHKAVRDCRLSQNGRSSGQG